MGVKDCCRWYSKCRTKAVDREPRKRFQVSARLWQVARRCHQLLSYWQGENRWWNWRWECRAVSCGHTATARSRRTRPEPHSFSNRSKLLLERQVTRRLCTLLLFELACQFPRECVERGKGVKSSGCARLGFCDEPRARQRDLRRFQARRLSSSGCTRSLRCRVPGERRHARPRLCGCHLCSVPRKFACTPACLSCAIRV